MNGGLGLLMNRRGGGEGGAWATDFLAIDGDNTCIETSLSDPSIPPHLIGKAVGS